MRTMKMMGMALTGAMVVAGCQSEVTAPADDLTGPGLSPAIEIDGTTGTGFVGKGDVQYTFGWNNAQLQQNADKVRFRAASTVVTERTWVCSRTNPQGVELTQERARTTTTVVQGLLSAVGRLRNQITGFNVLGYSGTPSVGTSSDGPALGSCPNFWTAGPISDPEEISNTSSFEVSPDMGATWTALLEKPAP